MSFQISFILGQAIALWLCAMMWILIAWCIPPLRRRPGISYGIAMILAVLFGVALIAQSKTGAPVVALVICESLLFWGYRRATKKQANQAPD